MALLYALFAIGYVLKAQAKIAILPAAEIKKKDDLKDMYPYQDGMGGRYKEMMEPQPQDIEKVLPVLKDTKRFKDLSECEVKKMAPGIQGQDPIIAVEVKCKDGSMLYVKITEERIRYIELLSEAPKKI
ncbi:hypothetical protein RF11_09133 [Thelohanellus kitauei]|uniref:Uncharacterized protein n=1 Tax=Thelohanellus kitauei TaxID=669202 RepID=A0A0C2NAU8_THEKT|nr:hypothetical protein RF11_09133 [Thelohanellus kitauei]